MRNSLLCLFISLVVCFAAPAHAAGKKQKKASKYPNLEISSFDVKDDIDVPQGFVQRIRKELPHRLADTQKFNRIFDEGDGVADKNAPTLVMKGSLIDFTSGNRAERYLIGLGAGAAEAVAHLKFVDAATGEAVFERDVTAKMTRGTFGGSSNGVADQLVKEIVKVVKNETF
jgi:hypothetical protein